MKTKAELEEKVRTERSAVLVVNTRSRKGERMFARAQDELARQGVKVLGAHLVREPARLPEVVAEALGRDTALVVVGGGDGTISGVVDLFAYKDSVLGVLPLGTGNSFARTLGIPLTVEGAVGVIAGGKVADVDLGKVEEDYFANVASLGFTVEVARRVSPRLKRYMGVLAYAVAGGQTFLSHRAFRCALTLNGESYTVTTHQVLIANGSFFGITPLLHGSHVDNRELVVMTMDGLNRWQMLKLWVKFFLRRPDALADAQYLRTREVTIDAEPRQYVNVDGETTTHTPITASLAPEALRVMVPHEFRDTD